ncbi:MAG: hypothetical protein ABDH91_08810 [Bacteroidia bacterium]
MTYSEAVAKLHPYRTHTLRELLGEAYTPGQSEVYQAHFTRLNVEHIMGRWTYIPPILRSNPPSLSEDFWHTEIGEALLTIATQHETDKEALADKLIEFVELDKTLGEFLQETLSLSSAEE